jgi:hypothetical protein
VPQQRIAIPTSANCAANPRDPRLRQVLLKNLPGDFSAGFRVHAAVTNRSSRTFTALTNRRTFSEQMSVTILKSISSNRLRISQNNGRRRGFCSQQSQIRPATSAETKSEISGCHFLMAIM